MSNANVYVDDQEKYVKLQIFDVLYGDEVCSLVYLKTQALNNNFDTEIADGQQV